MKILFLDRDGVINIENENGYILSVEAFEFYEKVPEAIKIFNKYFDKIIVVTNQRCVGRGLITEDGLQDIHDYMIKELNTQGATIHHVFYAPSVDNHHEDRKPNIGMGKKAIELYPQINLEASWMVGNNLSDMEFGKKLGLNTVFLSTTSAYSTDKHAELCDLNFSNLYDYALYLESQN